MAEAIVSGVMDQLASVIRKELEQEVRLVVGVRKELIKLGTKLTQIKAVLEDAENKEIRDNAVKVWLVELKDIAYDADDVLDEWNTRILISANGPHVVKVRRSYLLSMCACFKHVSVRHDIAHRIKCIREGLDEIAVTKDQLSLVQSHSHEEPRQLTSSVVDVSVICGRDLDKQMILSKLLCETSQQETQVHIPILSIVGTGGFGKTSLAQLLFNEGTIATTFELKIWVCVSQPFDLKRVAEEIIEQATGDKPPNMVGWEPLHQLLCNSLKGKRFLLVLDDVWTEDSYRWELLQLSLDGGERGSKIIITTRNEAVAMMIGSTYIHRLVQLSDDDCWHIFRRIAFWGRSEEECERLMEIGHEITKKCKGVPLAVKTLASQMRFKRAKEDWMGVLESDIWETQVRSFLPAILLSYHALPSVLKRCFMYCAIFPKDHNIQKEELVKLWMAQGFLGSDGARELERVGEEYFNALSMRSFFQDFKKDKDGNNVECKMHDLVHDFAQFLTKTDCSVLVNNDKISSHKVRHLTVDNIKNPSIYEAGKLRTLVARSSQSVPFALLFQELICLRTLDLSCVYGGFEVLPSEVNRLLHLRYLDLSKTRLKELPETVRSLVNLQTLKLNGCYNLCKLPEGIGELSNLRHLEVEDTSSLKYYPRGGIERLRQLRTLSKFVVRDGSEGSMIGELENLNFLKGRLTIEGLRHVKSVNEAKQAELQKKKNISELQLDFGDVRGKEAIRRMEGVLENLEPHKESLERLVIRYYAGFTLPRWMLSVEESVLSNIVDLKLDWCPNLKVLPALGKLQFLERLDLTGLKAVKHLGADLLRVENGASTSSSSVVLFPKLKYLDLYYLSEWKEEEHDVPTTIIIMPRLHTLKIGYCPKLKVEPHYLFPPRLETLELWGDVGVLSKSLIMSLTHNNNNLKSLTIKYFPHSSLPQGLNQLTSLQELNFYICKFLDFKPEELKPLTTLCTLEIDFCLIMSIRSREDWSILTHIPNIVIDYINITSNSYSYPGLPAIGGPIGHLLEQNAQVFKQISANFATLQIHDVHKNINLFCQTRDNILTIMNILNDMPGIMKEMPPLPVKLNEELANSILPRPTRPMRS